ncbi:MAG: hypothetical protein A4E50_00963 [Methanosaeta sp. PtaB.Bin087]|nr:MAG: hypothetical protein A4E50_00963 [Methanosaeta sp. PtaB.Bin087]
MDRYHKVLGVLLAVAFCWPMVAGADELSDLKQELEAQKTRAADLEDRINQLEARQKLKERSFEEKIEAVQAKAETEEPAQLPDNLQWLEKIKISGDFRYRYEYIDDGTRDDDYHRNRIRARIGITANVTDEWDLGFRLATGSGDPVSSNLTLEESLSSKPIRLDQAYVAEVTGIPTCVYGVGRQTDSNPHGSDENVTLEDLSVYARFLAFLILGWAAEEGGEGKEGGEP